MRVRIAVKFRNKYNNILSTLFEELPVIEKTDEMITLAVSEEALQLLLYRLQETKSLFPGPDADHQLSIYFLPSDEKADQSTS